MITIAYHKEGNAVFISHIDTLRSMVRLFRRTGAKVAYSQGFNPHMLLFFSPPLAIGVSSVAEYVTVDCVGVTAEEMLKLYNQCAPEGFKGFAAYETTKSPNLAGKIVAAKYVAPCSDMAAAKRAVDTVNAASEYHLSFLQKGEQIKKEVRGQIFSLELCDEGILATVATGNVNLRLDRLTQQFNEDFGTQIKITDVVKLQQFVRGDSGLIDAADYIVSEALK